MSLDIVHLIESNPIARFNQPYHSKLIDKLSLKFFGIVGDSSRIPLVTDKEAWHPGKQGVNILYADYSASKDVKFTTTP